MIVFILKRKWRLFFSWSNLSAIIGQCLILIVMLMVGGVLGHVYDLSQKKDVQVKPEKLIFIFSCILFLIPSILKFFPAIAAKKKLFQIYHPVSFLRRGIIELIISVFSKPWIYITLLSCLTAFFSSRYLSLKELTGLILVVIAGILMSENILNSFYLRNKLPICFLLVIFIYICSDSQHFLSYKVIVILDIALLIINICFNALSEIQYTSPSVSYFDKSKNLVLKVTSRNTKFISAVCFAILFQILFTYISCKYMLSELSITKYYLLSPIAIYAYCYNNLWGFFPALAINMTLSGKGVKELSFLYLKILGPILIICLSGIICSAATSGLAYSNKLFIGMIVMNVLAIANGLFFSFWKMKRIKNALSLDSNNFNTYLLPTYAVSAAGILLCSVENSTNYFMLVIIILIAISISQVLFMFMMPAQFTDRILKVFAEK